MTAAPATATPSTAPAPRPAARGGFPPLLRHLVLAVLAAIALYFASGVFSSTTNQRLTVAAYYFCAVAGLTVLTGLNGQISLGHGALMGIGGYTTTLYLGQERSTTVALTLAVVVTLGAGALVGVAAARLRGPYLAGATLALAVGLPPITIRFADTLGADNGITLVVPTAPPLLGENFDSDYPNRWVLIIAVAAALIVAVVLANLARSGVGRSFRAVRDDEIAASLAGINVARTQVLAFVVSAGCAGLGGGLLALNNFGVGPQAFTPILSLSLLTAIVLGGLGSLWGALWGSLALVYFPVFSDDFLAPALGVDQAQAPNIAFAAYGILLIVLMLVAPMGIQGGLRRLRTLLPRRAGGAPGTPPPGEAARDVTVEEYEPGGGPRQPSPVTPVQQPGVGGAGHGPRL